MVHAPVVRLDRGDVSCFEESSEQIYGTSGEVEQEHNFDLCSALRSSGSGDTDHAAFIRYHRMYHRIPGVVLRGGRGRFILE